MVTRHKKLFLKRNPCKDTYKTYKREVAMSLKIDSEAIQFARLQMQAFNTRKAEDRDFQKEVEPYSRKILDLANRISFIFMKCTLHGTEASLVEKAKKIFQGGLYVNVIISATEDDIIKDSTREPILDDDFANIAISIQYTVKGLFYQHLATLDSSALNPLLTSSSIQVVVEPKEERGVTLVFL